MTPALRLFLLVGVAVRLSAGAPMLTVTTPDSHLVFDAAEMAALPHVEITAQEPHGKKEHRYAGVAVRDLLLRAGAPLGAKLRGAALQTVIVVRARDGYAVVFSLADFDEAFGRRTIFLADQADNQSLPENTGPLQLVVPGDSKAARWVRMVTELEIRPGVPTGAADQHQHAVHDRTAAPSAPNKTSP